MLNSDYIKILTLIITLAGFYFAYFQYFKVTKERKRHLLKVLDGQLDCLGAWVGSDNGNGYGDELTEEQKYNNALPSKVIYNTGSSPLIDSTILEAMANVPVSIIGEINRLYYDLKRIESIQNYRNLLTSSDLKLSNSINQKIINYQKANPQSPFHHFLMTLKDKDDDLEKRFIEQLVSYGQTLHCTIIGNKNKGACQHWTKIKDWIKNEKKNEIKPNYVFIFITFFAAFLTLYLIQNLLIFPVNISLLILISVLITLIFSLISTAINFICIPHECVR